MTAAVIGIVLAVLIIFILVILGFREQKLDIPLPLRTYLASQEYAEIDPFDQHLKPVTNAMKIKAHAVYVKWAYKKLNGAKLICWVQTRGRGSGDSTNHLVAAVPNSRNSGEWILLCLPAISGISGKIVRKMLGWSIRSSNFWRAAPDRLGTLSEQCEFYIGDNVSVSPLNDELIARLPECGNVVLISTGSSVLIERISVTRNEPTEDEVKKLIRVSDVLAACL
jgi:hypothetical protein